MAKKKKDKAKSKGKGNKPTKGKATAPPGPRSRALPGMGRIRSQKLDNICEAIGDSRDTQASERDNENSLKQDALKEMQAKGIGAYRHAKIELLRSPGAEKLRVRKTKEDGDASTRGDVGDGAESLAGEAADAEIEAAEQAEDESQRL